MDRIQEYIEIIDDEERGCEKEKMKEMELFGSIMKPTLGDLQTR
jgi:hypothetical protein